MATAGTKVPQGTARSPQAVAVANFLRHNHTLKQREGILNGKRHSFFRVKRAMRALMSPEYQSMQAKSKGLLPVIETPEQAKAVFNMMPIGSFAYRVIKVKSSPEKPRPENTPNGVPLVEVVREQLLEPDMYYCWFYDPFQMKSMIYSGLALLVIFSLVLFPLWPVKLRLAVYYLSLGCMGLILAFFGIAIVRLIFFLITYLAVKPGIWIFPNLFEDVGVIESFIPFYAWNVPTKKKKKRS